MTVINDHETIKQFKDRGFMFRSNSTTSLYSLTINAIAIAQYNNTVIVCIAYSDTRYSSPPARLTVIGTYTVETA